MSPCQEVSLPADSFAGAASPPVCIYVFNVETVEEAQALVETDPAIQAGSLVMELRPWYGSAALVGVNDVHKTLSKTDIADP